jgi:DNA repair exonuclease SbcCD ATPase subunit
MRLARLTLRGITSFTQPVVIDLDSLGEGLVAVVGDNGAGKTTILESVFASPFKGFPSRPGSLYRIASGRDAFIESEWVDDKKHRIKVRLQIDAEKRSTFVLGPPVRRARKCAEETLQRYLARYRLLLSPRVLGDARDEYLQCRPA